MNHSSGDKLRTYKISIKHSDNFNIFNGQTWLVVPETVRKQNPTKYHLNIYMFLRDYVIKK